ncbi:hypothetical protein [Nonomuraea sediminis]|uniref:hypothetical protein n=1 Tax=Nonomuraea sediminis TaxID=2835864 RepID=UPI001BDBD843|nr:hypothetical protein [Nonomuraea sediminis]
MGDLYGALPAILCVLAFLDGARRARRGPADSARIFRNAFLLSGVVLLLFAVLGATPSLLEIYRDSAGLMALAGIGMLIGAVACALAERRS